MFCPVSSPLPQPPSHSSHGHRSCYSAPSEPRSQLPSPGSKRSAGQARRSCARSELDIDALWTIESCCQRCLLEKRKGKAATYRDRRYRQLQKYGIGRKSRSEPGPVNWRLKHADRGCGTINLVARAIDPTGEVRRGSGQVTDSNPDSDGPSETRPGFTITQRSCPPWPPSRRSWPRLHVAVAPHEPRRTLTAPSGRSRRGRRPAPTSPGGTSGVSSGPRGHAGRNTSAQVTPVSLDAGAGIRSAGQARIRKAPGYGATPGGYGGKPPGVAFIGVPTGARNAGCGAPTGDQSTDMNATRKPPRMCQDPITSPSRVSAGNRSRCRSPIPYVMNARTGR
jgi:hypothetical protein